MFGGFRQILPSSGGYFVLSTVSLIRSQISLAEQTPTDALGLSTHAPLLCIHPDWHMFDGLILPLSYL